MAYFLRNKKGHLKAKINNTTAGMVFERAHGEWKEIEQTDGKKTVYVITKDCAIGDTDFFPIKLYFWAGDYLVVDNG